MGPRGNAGGGPSTATDPAYLNWLNQQQITQGYQQNGSALSSAMFGSDGKMIGPAQTSFDVGGTTGDFNTMAGMLGAFGAAAVGGVGAASGFGGSAVPGEGSGIATSVGGSTVADTVAGATPAVAAGGGGGGGLFGTGLTLQNISQGLSIASSLNGITGGALFGNKSVSGSQAQNNADPFAPYRPGVAADYAAALSSGGTTDPTKMPGYSQWMSGVLNPAMSAVAGKDAAMGLNGSTNQQTDLLKTAQNNYYGFMTDYMNRLAQGSGAVNNPAPAAGQGLGQSNLNQSGMAQGVGALNQGIQTLNGYQSSNSTAGMPSYNTDTNQYGGGDQWAGQIYGGPQAGP
jgi:hypothetical protein